MKHDIMTVLAAFGLLMSLQVESSAAGATITPSATLERAAPSRFYKNSDWNFSLVHRGLLEDDLKILNYYQQQPPVIQELFSTAYKRLGADKNATFSKCPELREACRGNGITHLGGPMLGALAADGARVWMRTVEPAQVKVLVTVDGAEKVFGPVASTAASDLTAVVQVNGLKPDSRYPYRVTINDKPIAMPPTSVITTAPKASQNGKVNIAFGADFHKTGIQNGQLLDLVRARHNAAFLVYGDIAVQDRRNHFGRHRADYLLRDFSRPWQNLVAAVPVYATWDDHDYFDDDLAGVPEGFTAADRAAVSQVWQQAWNNPSAGFGDERDGIFFRTRIGPCDIIMLDTRSLRGSDKADTSGDSLPFLGGAQLRWLEQQLLDCKGPFIILSSGTMWSDYVSNGKDSWGKVDRPTRERIFRFIEDKKIGGVLLLSGDRHGARGFQIPRPSGFTFHEFEIGSLGGHHKGGPSAWAPDRSKQLFGFELISAFGEFDINAALPDPEVTFRLIQDTGKELYTITLKRSQLTPPSKTGQTL